MKQFYGIWEKEGLAQLRQDFSNDWSGKSSPVPEDLDVVFAAYDGGY